MNLLEHLIIPDWPAPARVQALQTTRQGGISIAPCDNFNLGSHVGDNPLSVEHNRILLNKLLPSEPVWLEQVHGKLVANADLAGCVPYGHVSLARPPHPNLPPLTGNPHPIPLPEGEGSFALSPKNQQLPFSFVPSTATRGRVREGALEGESVARGHMDRGLGAKIPSPRPLASLSPPASGRGGEREKQLLISESLREFRFTADACIARHRATVCAVLTADCLPVLLCDTQGSVVGAAHAGWKGLAAGVIEATVSAMGVSPKNLMAWLGPAISQEFFEVGDEVRAVFVANDPQAVSAFVPGRSGKWFADIHALARLRLNALDITQIYGGDHCTFREREKFFSYRRDCITGRMGTFIWLE